MSGSRSGFFAVGRDSFVHAVTMGMNAGAAFVILARGSGANNVTSTWSAEAIANRLGMRWTTAREAIAQLERQQLVTATRSKTARGKPRYALQKRGELIWLPNSLVDGAAGSHPPLAMVRQTQDAMVLRLLVELYSSQNLREDGGISPAVIWEDFERQRLGQRGPYVVWGFDREQQCMRWGPVTNPHWRDKLTKEEREQGHGEGDDFFRRFGHLLRLGLVLEIPYLFDGPEGEPIHPLAAASDVELERAIAESATGAAMACLSDGQVSYLDGNGWPDIVVPVPAHIEQATVKSVYRLRHRPQTKLTAAWWAELQTSGQEYLEGYRRIGTESIAHAA